MSDLDKQKSHCIEDQFFGSVTVGERGQVVIPAEARKRLGIHPGDKILVVGHPFASALMLVKMDSMREFLTGFMNGLTIAEGGNETASHNTDNANSEG